MQGRVAAPTSAHQSHGFLHSLKNLKDGLREFSSSLRQKVGTPIKFSCFPGLLVTQKNPRRFSNIVQKLKTWPRIHSSRARDAPPPSQPSRHCMLAASFPPFASVRRPFEENNGSKTYKPQIALDSTEVESSGYVQCGLQNGDPPYLSSPWDSPEQFMGFGSYEERPLPANAQFSQMELDREDCLLCENFYSIMDLPGFPLFGPVPFDQEVPVNDLEKWCDALGSSIPRSDDEGLESLDLQALGSSLTTEGHHAVTIPASHELLRGEEAARSVVQSQNSGAQVGCLPLAVADDADKCEHAPREIIPPQNPAAVQPTVQESFNDVGPGTHESAQARASNYSGIRFKDNKWTSEIRPPLSKRTVWLGSYNTRAQAARAYDVGIFYFQKGIPYNFPDSPHILPPIIGAEGSEERLEAIKEQAKVYGTTGAVQADRTVGSKSVAPPSGRSPKCKRHRCMKRLL